MTKPIVTMTDNGDGETVVTFDLGNGHRVTFETWNDVGTYRVLEKYVNTNQTAPPARVRDITNGGGHVEDRQVDAPHMPPAYEVSVQ